MLWIKCLVKERFAFYVYSCLIGVCIYTLATVFVRVFVRVHVCVCVCMRVCVCGFGCGCD